MSKFLVLIILALAITAVAQGQANENPGCPNTIALDGGPFGSDIGALVRYSVKIDTGGRHFDLTYNWSASTPEYGDGDPSKIRQIEVPIEKGQGTDEVEVRLPGSYLDIKVIIGGLPSGCPNELTESTVLDKGPPAHMIGEVTAGDPAEYLLADVAQQTKASPNDELYILSRHVGGKASGAVLAREQNVLYGLLKKGVDRRQIMVAGVNAKVESVQFWLVPPGAELPQYNERATLESGARPSCPTITVIGPAGIFEPGEVATFTATVYRHSNVTYSWTISQGEIVDGQNTLAFRIRIPKTYDGTPIVATLEVAGLPAGCPNTFSVPYQYTVEPDPILVDKYGAGAVRLPSGYAHLKAAIIEAPACPTISITGPAGITNPGEIAIFAAEISGNTPPKVVYVWTVSEGAIVSGQNTLSVQVRYPKTEASNLTATLVVRGLPESCSSEFSVAAPFVIDPGPLLIDEYGAITPQNEHAHLKAAVAQLKRNPNSMLWIIFYPTGSDASIKRKEKSLSDYLTKIQHIGELFKIVVGPNIGLEKTKILIIPPGVENPQP